MFIPFTNKEKEFRYERKFPIKEGLMSRSEMDWHIKTNTSFFSEIYEKRQINSIYFDTNSFDLYLDNVVGQSRRFKFRIRWYGENIQYASKPKLEIKVKYGLTGDKWLYPLSDFNVNELNQEKMIQLARSNKVSELIVEQLHFLYPVLLNTYQRNYYLSGDKKFRLTLDEDMNFYQFTNTSGALPNHRKADTDFVVELKYKLENDFLANRISTQFPFRLDKFSKYITGCDFFYIL